MSQTDPAAAPAPSAPPTAPVATSTSQPPATPQATGDTPDLGRLQQQMAGYQKIADPLIRAGLRDPEQIISGLERTKRYEGLISTLEESGMDPDQIAAMFRGTRGQQQNATPDAERPLTAADLPKLTDSILSTMTVREQESAHAAALSAHQNTTNALVDEFAQSVGDRDMVEDLVLAEVRRHETLYPPGHPLRDKELRPLDADAFKVVREKVQARLSKAVGASIRQEARAQLDGAARAGSALQPTGQQGQEQKSFIQMSQADKLARVQGIREKTAALYGNPR